MEADGTRIHFCSAGKKRIGFRKVLPVGVPFFLRRFARVKVPEAENDILEDL